MLKTTAIFLFFAGMLAGTAFAQDTLPHISVKDLSGKIIISWKNNYGARVTTINIQRSADSIKNFTTIGSVLEPLNKENGFVDTKASDTKMFYRVFVSFAGGRYLFSTSQRPTKDTIAKNNVIGNPPSIEEPVVEEPVKPVVPKGYVPSKFVYTGKDNNLTISLPDAASKKYVVKIFDENDNPIFEINKITEPFLIVERANFLHSGWFHFQLLENGELKEKHKFFIAKDGKNASNNHERGIN